MNNMDHKIINSDRLNILIIIIIKLFYLNGQNTLNLSNQNLINITLKNIYRY